MVRINLMPVRAAKKKQEGRQQILLMGLVLAAVILGMSSWVGALTSERRSLETKIAATNQEIAQLELVIGEVKKHADAKALLEAKLKVIEDLNKSRTGPVKLLDEIAQSIPKKVWLTKLEEKSGMMSFMGEASNDEDIAVFMQELRKMAYFQNLTLKYTKVAERDGMRIKQFELECRVNYAI